MKAMKDNSTIRKNNNQGLLVSFVLLGLVTSLLFAGEAAAQEWGDLTGQFLYDGKAPVAKLLSVTKDVEVCAKHALKDESLVVNPKNSGVANIVIALYRKRGGKKPKIHPAYKPGTEVIADNLKCRFAPHVIPLWTRQVLLIKNSDSVGHNTKIDTLKNKAFNKTLSAGGQEKVSFKKAEKVPVSISCSVHPWMRSWLVVKDTPYVAVTDKDGKFTIKNLPAGKWTFQVWHEKAGYVSKVINSEGKKKKWKRGRVKVTVKAGSNDLGVFKIAPKVFK